MIPLRAILVDDERLARQQLGKVLQLHSGIELVGEASNLSEAIALLEGDPPDVIFLDISMPPESGFDLLGHIPPTSRVVFVTADEEYAVRAFEARALDYLLKPVQPTRLALVIERLRDAASWKNRSASVVLGNQRSWSKVSVEEISSVRSEGNYSRAYTMDGRSYFVRRTLQEWIKMLAEEGFFILSRSLLVNPAAVIRLDGVTRNETALYLAGSPEPVKLGRTAASRARRLLASEDLEEESPVGPLE